MRLIRLLIFSTLFCIGYPVASQGQAFIPFNSNGIWGYMVGDNQIVIEPRFEAAKIFYPNERAYNPRLGQIKENGLWGVIDDNGEYILEPKFDTIVSIGISSSKGSLIRVARDGKDQYYGIEGRRVRRFEYRSSYICGKAFYLSCLETESLDLLNIVSVQQQDNEKYNLISKWHKRIDGHVEEFNDTVLIMADRVYLLRGWVFLEKEGKTAIIKRRDIYGRSEDLLNKIEFVYDEVAFFLCPISSRADAYDKYVQIRVKDKWGILYLDIGDFAEQKTIIKPRYKSIVSRKDKYFLVEYGDGMTGYVSTEGHEYW